MRILGSVAPRNIEGADEVFDGLLGQVESGNKFCLWPAMTHDNTFNRTRIAFFALWWQMVTPADLAELTALTNSLMGQPLSLLIETNGDPCTDGENLNWLRTGEPPKPKKPQ